MKKTISILLCACMLAAVFSGCGSQTAPPSGSGGGGSSKPAVTTKVLRASTPTEPGAGWSMALDYIAERIEERTNGAYKIDVYYNASLSEGSEKTMLEQVFVGTLDMCVTPASLADARWSAFSVPFQFDSREHIWRVCESDVVQEMMDAMSDKGMKTVGIVENGYRQITNNVREIKIPADTKGIKLRTPQAPTSIAIAELMGFNSVAISAGELYVALQQGTADGQENALTTIYAKGFYEIQKYISIVNYNWSPALIGINQDLWDTFDADTQAVFTQLIKEGAKYCNDTLAAEDAAYIDKLKEKGMQVYICTDADIAEWKRVMAPAYSIYEKDVGAELMKKFSAAVDACR